MQHDLYNWLYAHRQHGATWPFTRDGSTVTITCHCGESMAIENVRQLEQWQVDAAYSRPNAFDVTKLLGKPFVNSAPTP
jgi:hypothetical protein